MTITVASITEVELRLLRYYVAVAEELHFGRAAQRLFVAQPSLSVQIRKLEDELGAALFIRNRRGVQLTPAGRALLDPARDILRAVDRLPRQAQQAAGGSGQLTIGYVPYARSSVLAELMDRLRVAEPDARITVRAGNSSPEVFAELRDGQIDAALFGSRPDAAWLGLRTVAVEPFYVALPTGHPLARLEHVPLRRLAGETFALFPRELNPGGHDHLMTFFAQAGFTPRIGQASRRMDESLLFVASGAGVGLFPVSVARATNEPAVVFRPVTDPTPTIDITLGWDVHSRNPLVRRLIDCTPEVASLQLQSD